MKRRIAKPKFLQQKIDNVNVCLQFLQTEIGLKVIGCNPQGMILFLLLLLFFFN